jgi:hypothetical protein
MCSRVTLQPQVRLGQADAGHAQGDGAGLAQGPGGVLDLLAFVVGEPVEVGLHAADQCADALDLLVRRSAVPTSENIEALSQYLGHSDPGFTLRVYTHLMGNGESRTREAVDSMYQGIGPASDGPETAQAA